MDCTVHVLWEHVRVERIRRSWLSLPLQGTFLIPEPAGRETRERMQSIHPIVDRRGVGHTAAPYSLASNNRDVHDSVVAVGICRPLRCAACLTRLLTGPPMLHRSPGGCVVHGWPPKNRREGLRRHVQGKGGSGRSHGAVEVPPPARVIRSIVQYVDRISVPVKVTTVRELHAASRVELKQAHPVLPEIRVGRGMFPCW